MFKAFECKFLIRHTNTVLMEPFRTSRKQGNKYFSGASEKGGMYFVCISKKGTTDFL